MDICYKRMHILPPHQGAWEILLFVYVHRKDILHGAILEFLEFRGLFSILMALGSTIGMRVSFSNKSENSEHKYLRVCLALTIGFLWLRVLGLAETVNVQLATFVLAIIQVS